MEKIDFKIPEAVEFIINKIESQGYQAFCVGGAVRDTLRGKKPHDYDIATSMPSEQTLRVFEKVIPTGLKHGTVTIIIDGCPYEVTRFRIDGEYLDHRKPETVEFTDDFTLDLSRRDFTINAMGYNKTSGLIDPFGGALDLENKIIRTVGNPRERFKEDALRILRAVRFSAILDFKIEQDTLSAIMDMAPTLDNISAERIAVELTKTLSSKNPSKIELIINHGGLEKFGLVHLKKPEILNSIPNIDFLRLSVLILLCDIDCKECVNSLKLSNDIKNKTIACFDVLSKSNFDVVKVKRLAEIIPYNLLKYLAEAYGIIYGENLQKEYNILDLAFKSNEPYCTKMLNINGEKLKSLGFEGKEIGEVQEKLLNFVLENPQKNTENELLEHIKG